jgi:sugar lactone lactonase YvrE
MSNKILNSLALGLAIAAFAGCASTRLPNPTDKVYAGCKPELFVRLDNTVTVPDGMSIDKNGDIIMAAPNYVRGDGNKNPPPSKLVRITAKGEVSDWFTALPLHAETKEVHPMGMEFGPDGNLYVADNQYFANKEYKSRLLRVVVENGKPVRCEVAADGFKLANAVRWNGNACYVSDTFFDLKDKKNQSGVYRLTMKEMKAGKVTLKPNATDSRLVAQYTSKDLDPKGATAGADGVCIDSKGNLYCGNFGDGVISRTKFCSLTGKPVSQQIVIDSPAIECCDGIVCDQKTDRIYITNSKNNSIHVYDIRKNTLQTLWVNDDNDGATGLLDQPCEPLVYKGDLIIVNFDMSFPGLKNQKDDEVHTISKITLPKD